MTTPATAARNRRLHLTSAAARATSAAVDLAESVADARVAVSRTHPAVVALCAAQRFLDSGRVLVGCAMDVERAAS